MPCHWLYMALEKELPSASSSDPRNLLFTRGNGQQSFWPTEIVPLILFINSPAFSLCLVAINVSDASHVRCTQGLNIDAIHTKPESNLSTSFLFWWSRVQRPWALRRYDLASFTCSRSILSGFLGKFWCSRSPILHWIIRDLSQAVAVGVGWEL